MAWTCTQTCIPILPHPLPHTHRLKQEHLFFKIQRKIMQLFAFLFTSPFSTIRQLCKKTTVGSRIIWSVTTWMRLTKAKQWSLKKLRHSVVVLHQFTFIESHTVFQANCCVSPPRPSRQTVWHHKLTLDNDLYDFGLSVRLRQMHAAVFTPSGEYFCLAQVRRRGKKFR